MYLCIIWNFTGNAQFFPTLSTMLAIGLTYLLCLYYVDVCSLYSEFLQVISWRNVELSILIEMIMWFVSLYLFIYWITLAFLQWNQNGLLCVCDYDCMHAMACLEVRGHFFAIGSFLLPLHGFLVLNSGRYTCETRPLIFLMCS